MRVSRRKLYVWLVVVGGIVVLGFGLSRMARRSIEISNNPNRPVAGKGGQKSPLTGIECETGKSRPFAVMVSSDKEARPLSGIGEADMVFEMPVVPNGFTRMMAVYQCGRPKEVGSVRSSRLDFVPLALGLNAIYAHFGGEQTVLKELNDGVIDNIDGLKYDGTYYYRKKGIKRPHNSFTNFDLLTEISTKLGYSLSDSKVSYPHSDDKSRGQIEPGPIFNEKFQVDWKYDKSSNTYLRSRSGSPELDKNTGRQVAAKNVAVLKTSWSPINQDYIRVKTVGSGEAVVYRNGQAVAGSWSKKNDKTKLFLYDKNGKEIKFAPGNVWFEIVIN